MKREDNVQGDSSLNDFQNMLFIVSSRGGSSRRAARLQPSLTNERQKIPPNSPLILDLVAKYSQHNYFRYFRHHFWLNVS